MIVQLLQTYVKTRVGRTHDSCITRCEYLPRYKPKPSLLFRLIPSSVHLKIHAAFSQSIREENRCTSYTFLLVFLLVPRKNRFPKKTGGNCHGMIRDPDSLSYSESSILIVYFLYSHGEYILASIFWIADLVTRFFLRKSLSDYWHRVCFLRSCLAEDTGKTQVD